MLAHSVDEATVAEAPADGAGSISTSADEALQQQRVADA
jgi:hypothetical protein